MRHHSDITKKDKTIIYQWSCHKTFGKIKGAAGISVETLTTIFLTCLGYVVGWLYRSSFSKLKPPKEPSHVVWCEQFEKLWLAKKAHYKIKKANKWKKNPAYCKWSMVVATSHFTAAFFCQNCGFYVGWGNQDFSAKHSGIC